jgi:hypothetical protein
MFLNVHIKDGQTALYRAAILTLLADRSIHDLGLASDRKDSGQINIHFGKHSSRQEDGILLLFFNGKARTRQVDYLQIDFLPGKRIAENYVWRGNEFVARAPELFWLEPADLRMKWSQDKRPRFLAQSAS